MADESPDEVQDFTLSDNWRENRKLVHAELSRANRGIDRLGDKISDIDLKLTKDLTDMKIEIATIKTKVLIYGGLAAIILSALINYLLKG